MPRQLSDKQIIKAAKQAGYDYREAGGSHFMITDPKDHSAMTCYHSKEISPGVSCKIIKWFLVRGVVICIAILLYCYLFM